MRLRTQLLLAVTLVALAAVSVTALLSVQVSSQRVGRLLDMPAAGAPAGTTRPPAAGNGAMSGMPSSLPPNVAARHAALTEDLWRANLQAAGIALLLALVVGTALSLRLAGPLDRLTEVANRYAAGERRARADERGRDEVADVARAFNHVADSLQREEDEQQRLLADIAHEFRTPLTVLKGELEALEDGLVEPAPPTYRRLGEEVTLLERLVQDLRLLTQAESGDLTLHLRSVELARLVEDVVASFLPHAAQRGVRVGATVEPARVRADPDRIRQVLVNLLDNAVRYAPPDSDVDVTLRHEAGRALLGVRDRGPGIPQDEREQVFRRFYRVDRARSRATGGSGLGLAIVRSLVELHGGTVDAADHPDGGAVLTVTLPLEAAA